MHEQVGFDEMVQVNDKVAGLVLENICILVWERAEQLLQLQDLPILWKVSSDQQFFLAQIILVAVVLM